MGLLSFEKYVTVFVVLPIPVLRGHDPHQTWSKTGAQATAMKTCESRSQKQVQHYRETMTFFEWLSLRRLNSRDQVGSACPRAWNGSLEMRRDCLGRWEVWHLQQVMMSVRWRKSLQSVVFLALCVGQVRWTIASGHIWRTLITVSARFIPVNVGPLLAGIGSFNRRLYFATVNEGCTPNRHDSTEVLVQYSLAQVQLTTQLYHTRVELYSNIPTGHSAAIPTWYCG